MGKLRKINQGERVIGQTERRTNKELSGTQEKTVFKMAE
jgi:hypothetical protein